MVGSSQVHHGQGTFTNPTAMARQGRERVSSAYREELRHDRRVVRTAPRSGGEPGPAALAAGPQGRPASPGRHPVAKAVLPRPPAAVGLERALHRGPPRGPPRPRVAAGRRDLFVGLHRNHPRIREKPSRTATTVRRCRRPHHPPVEPADDRATLDRAAGRSNQAGPRAARPGPRPAPVIGTGRARDSENTVLTRENVAIRRPRSRVLCSAPCVGRDPRFDRTQSRTAVVARTNRSATTDPARCFPQGRPQAVDALYTSLHTGFWLGSCCLDE